MPAQLAAPHACTSGQWSLGIHRLARDMGMILRGCDRTPGRGLHHAFGRISSDLRSLFLLAAALPRRCVREHTHHIATRDAACMPMVERIPAATGVACRDDARRERRSTHACCSTPHSVHRADCDADAEPVPYSPNAGFPECRVWTRRRCSADNAHVSRGLCIRMSPEKAGPRAVVVEEIGCLEGDGEYGGV